MTKLSPHLSLEELACHDARGTPYPAAWILTRAIPLAEVFEAIRLVAGNRPIGVSSGYRTPAHNAAIGGVPDSQHCEGRALDLLPPAGMTVRAFYDLVRLCARTCPALRGLGAYPTFVHIDIRESPTLVCFRGGRPQPDLELAAPLPASNAEDSLPEAE